MVLEKKRNTIYENIIKTYNKLAVKRYFGYKNQEL